MFDYQVDPVSIEKQSFTQIRQLTDLQAYSLQEQQVVMRIVHSLGLPEAAKYVRFSERACEQGMAALAKQAPILCDVEMVKQGITKRMINQPPLCFINDPQVALAAKDRKQTRSMAAVEQWLPHLQGSVVVIANAPTALFRLLELIEQTQLRPALVVGMPVGFVGAAESKDALWQHYQHLDIQCITLLGRIGGSAVSAATINALLRCNLGELY